MNTHGAARRGQQTPEYRAWCDMIQRTTNPRCQQYARYGERGVSVCECWRKSFRAFLADVGRRPGPGYSLDRYPDQRGNYEPGNVRWASRVEQNRNRKNVRIVVIDGVSQTLPEWIEQLGIPASTVHSRIKLGWTVKRALLTPSQGRRKEKGLTMNTRTLTAVRAVG